MKRLGWAALVLAGLAAGCATLQGDGVAVDSMRATPREAVGESTLSLQWSHATADRRDELRPQEFASVAVWGDTVFTGSDRGEFVALRAQDGHVRWRRQLSAMHAPTVVHGGLLYLGLVDGTLVCLDALTGDERWRYRTQGAIGEAPVIAGDVVVFSNEADQVYALNAITGDFKWQYKVTSPEEYTLRGHAGVTVDRDLAFTGFANGTLVALRVANGSVAWSASLRGDQTRFVDVDGTPVVHENAVLATSASGGVYAVDRDTGLVRWRQALLDPAAPTLRGVIGGLTADPDRLYVAVAELGVYALDFDGHVVWRQATSGGGEPATPVVAGNNLLFSLAHDGLYVADRATGRVREYFDPGDGVSGTPVLSRDGQLFVLSNRGILYAFAFDS